LKSADKDTLTPSFIIGMYDLYFFSSVIALLKTVTAIWNWTSETSNHCPICSLLGKAFGVSPATAKFAVVFIVFPY
jgi:hypothetical protein